MEAWMWVVGYLWVGFACAVGAIVWVDEDEEMAPIIVMTWPILAVGGVILGFATLVSAAAKRVARVFRRGA